MKGIEVKQTWRYKKLNRPNVVIINLNKYSGVISYHHLGDEKNKFETAWGVFLDTFEQVEDSL